MTIIRNRNKYMLDRYHKIRSICIGLLGGKCTQCESVENLEFDHINKINKSFHIGKIMNVSLGNLYKELPKCQLLCKKCHLDKTIRESRIMVHGTQNMYKKYKCRCDDCTIANKIANKRYKNSKQ